MNISENSCLHVLLGDQVEKTPDAIALSDGGRQLTYQELDERSNQVAHYLVSHGAKTEVPFGIYLDRSIELVVTIWGVLKSGGVCVPLDISMPQKRLQAIVEETGLMFVLTGNIREGELPPGVPVKNLDKESLAITAGDTGSVQVEVTPDSLSYIVYTSGSSGKPKGVMIPHRSFSRCRDWATEVFGFSNEDRFLLNFVRAPEEIFYPLFVGATLILPPAGSDWDMKLLGRTILHHRISVLGLTPSLLNVFLNENESVRLDSLKNVYCAGEPLSVENQRRFFNQIEANLYNFYGLAEAPFTSLWKCHRDEQGNAIPIGEPVDASVHILDENAEPVKKEKIGEIYVGGPGLARGYLNLPELTEERFITRNGTKLYRTGDRAFFDAAGHIFLAGRSDHQIQIRGLRVEKEEIENALIRLSGVREAAVEFRDQQLIAFLTLDQSGKVALTHWQSNLASTLPDYMRPSLYVLLDALPRTSTGKIDRRALPPPEKTVLTDLRSLVLPAGDRQKVLSSWNATESDFPREACIHQLFEETAASHPGAISVIFGQQKLTYHELNERSNQVAHFLIDQGVRPDQPVAVCLERSPELIIALLGILKAGGTYLPLDPANPSDWLTYVLDHSGAKLLLTQDDLLEDLQTKSCRRIGLSPDGKKFESFPFKNPKSEAGSLNLAYITYTSGSTGHPKGVCIPHRGVVRLVRGADYFPFCDRRIFIQSSPVSFDLATFEIWGALLNGARLVIPPHGIITPPALAEIVVRHQVDTLWLTSSFFNLIVDQGRIAELDQIDFLLVGGEALSPPHIRQALDELKTTRLINGYGPTESTTFTCCFTITGSTPEQSIPIGRPIANTQVYILDEQLQPVPLESPGELCIGGDGLARGYLNNAELTDLKFIELPGRQLGFNDDKPVRIYRSGDRACWRADGILEFIGRIDDQIKLRGFLVEPREIERTLRRNSFVQDAVVVTVGQDQLTKQLVAYVIPNREVRGNADSIDPKDEKSFKESLRDWLKRELPEYMVPSTIVTLDAMPLNANGKVDQRALPAPETADRSGDIRKNQPASILEERLLKIWRKVLGLDDIGVHDNFFDLGGHSLQGLDLLNEVEREFGIRWPVRMLFESPTVSEWSKMQAPWKDSDSNESKERMLVKLNQRDRGTPIFLLPGGMGTENELMVFASLARNFEIDNPVYGVRAPLKDFSVDDQISIPQLAKSYLNEFRKIQPAGPYLLLGECLAGVVAYEIARQLAETGDEKSQLILLDSTCPPGESLADFKASGYQELEKDHGGELASQVFPYYLAMLSYSPAPFRGRVTIIATDASVDLHGETLGWGNRITGKLTVKRVSGDHSSYIRDDAETTGQLIGELFAEAEDSDSDEGRVSANHIR
ncbi:MAG: amino acid adenylation domain-containing protein [Verrucomicrobiales bacterium]|nr:amino acid adenylation domain-containing protein [Verrucomicrobiales bacterium]